MALVGGTCWGFSGCCGQYLFEQKGMEAPWLVAVRLFFAGIIPVSYTHLGPAKMQPGRAVCREDIWRSRNHPAIRD